MKDLINWIILGLAGIGAVYAIGLVVLFALLPKEEERASLCDCGCGSAFPMDICSSECDQKCKDNNHYEWCD